MRRTIIYLFMLVIVLLTVPASAQYRLAAIVTDGDPDPDEDNIFVRFEIPEEDYNGFYKLEVNVKGPWKINIGHDFYSPQDCTGKEVLTSQYGDLPWWGDALDPTWHYEIKWNGRLELKKLPWEQCTLNAVAYRSYDRTNWRVITSKTVKLHSGHKHRIRYTGSTETGWYDDPARTLFQTGVLLVSVYSYAEVGASVLIEKKAFESFGCKPLAKRLAAAIQKEALKLAPGVAGHFVLRVTGASQWKCRTKTYDYCCFHYNDPDTWVINNETVPQVFGYEARLIEQRYLITVAKGQSKRKATLCQGFLSEDDITGRSFWNSGCLEPTDYELPTIMWVDIAKNKRYIWRYWLNHKDRCARYIKPCECSDEPAYTEGF